VLSPEELRELRRLHIVAGRRADTVFTGEYRSAVKGQGMEFEEVREYAPGDDIRHIDWNVTARTGEPFVKVFREERQVTVLLVVDVSGSTRVGSGGADGRTDRRRQMARIAGAMAFAALRNRDRIGVVTFSDQIESYVQPRRTRGHAGVVLDHVFRDFRNGRSGTDIRSALDFVRQVQRRRAVVILVSDFIGETDWERSLRGLSRRHDLHGILVDDPMDAALSGLGLVRIFDPETGHRRLVDAASLSGVEPVASRLQRLKSSGASAVALSTADDPYLGLHRHFRSVSRRR
jgi:uncharacterized protein (DUF58 family)